MSINRIQIDSLESKTSLFRKMESKNPPIGGWVHAIRTSLSMTLTQVANRVGTNAARIRRIEQDEILGSVTLKTLRNVAESMNSELVYAIVPKKEIKQILIERYIEKHIRKKTQLQRHMMLEGQGVPKDLTIENIVIEDINTKGLWDD